MKRSRIALLNIFWASGIGKRLSSLTSSATYRRWSLISTNLFQGVRHLRVLRPARRRVRPVARHDGLDRLRLQPLVPQALHQAQEGRRLVLLQDCQVGLLASGMS